MANRDPELRRLLAEGPFHRALQHALRARRIPLQALCRELAERGTPVADATVSAWARGVNRPERPASLAALGNLEAVLGLPPSALSGLLGARRRRGRRASRPTPEAVPTPALVCDSLAMSRLLARIDRPSADSYAVESLHEFHEIGPQRRPVRHTTRHVIRATGAELDRYWYIFALNDTRRPAAPVAAPAPAPAADLVSPGIGCHVGRVVAEPPDLVAVELLFGRTVARGQTHLFEYATTLHYEEPPAPEFSRGLPRPARELLIDVGFHPAARPARVWAARWIPGRADTAEEDLELRPDGHVHVLYHRPAAGRYTVGWSWPPGPAVA